MRTTVTIRYPAGHMIISEWEACNLWCPNCGEDKTVWVELYRDDYYMGATYICVACETTFNYNGTSNTGTINNQIAEQLINSLSKAEDK